MPDEATSFADPDGGPGSAYRVRAYNAGGYSPPALLGGTPLTADIVDVVPDPRTAAVEAVRISFNHRVYGLGASDFRLTRAGGNLTGVNGAGGAYELRLAAATPAT